MTSDNPFPDDTDVLARFPRSKAEERGDRSAWPWLAGVIQQRCGEDGWQVALTDRSVAESEDGTVAPEETPADDLWFPARYRDASEIKLRPAA